MASVTFDKATRLYPGSTRPAVDQIDLEVADGEFLVLVGPSGCGKSTTLRMLAGLEEVNDGRILIGDRDVTDVPPKDRDIAMVFQNYALYPHMTVAENMGFALKIAGVGKEDRAKRVLEAAKLLDLEPYLGRKPKALSGGQRQRVAMGRAIVRQPQVFLMDEPLSNLDAKLRVQTRTQIASLQRRLGVTTVYVTHDQTEALTMGDRIAVLKDGILQQVGTPRDLYEKPNNVFVAGFIGSPAMNLFPADLAEGGVKFGSAIAKVDRETLEPRQGQEDHDRRPPRGPQGRHQGRRPQGRRRRRRGARRRRLPLRAHRDRRPARRHRGAHRRPLAPERRRQDRHHARARARAHVRHRDRRAPERRRDRLEQGRGRTDQVVPQGERRVLRGAALFCVARLFRMASALSVTSAVPDPGTARSAVEPAARALARRGDRRPPEGHLAAPRAVRAPERIRHRDQGDLGRARPPRVRPAAHAAAHGHPVRRSRSP